MASDIKINKLKCDISRKNFSEKYDVFKIHSENKIRYSSKILDFKQLDKKIISVFHNDMNDLFVMMDKDRDNFILLKKVLLDKLIIRDITIKQQDSDIISDRVIVCLLLNGLNNYDIEMLRFSNLTGKLYCFNNRNLKWKKIAKKDIIWQIVALEIAVTKDMCLSFDVVTFSLIEFLKNSGISKSKLMAMPKYILNDYNALVRNFDRDLTNCFIKKQITRKKSSVSFLEIRSNEEFKSSKSGILQEIISRFNKKYRNICNLDFERFTNYIGLRSKFSIKRDEKIVNDLIRQNRINLIDLIGDNDSKKVSERFQNEAKLYDLDIVKVNRPEVNSLNICLIHEKDFYEESENKDPYSSFESLSNIQHITLELLKGLRNSSHKALFRSLKHELLIKKDIKDLKFSLFDWSSLKLKESIVFTIKEIIDENSCFVSLKVSPCGSFEFIISEDFTNFDELYYFYEDIFSKDKQIEFIITYDDKHLEVVSKTSIRTIANLDMISDNLNKGITKLRNKEKRDELFNAITDIKFIRENDFISYYFSGNIAEPMRYSIPKACVLRKIESLDEKPIRFLELLPTLNVSFVNNNKLTVLPFPIKYLREFFKCHNKG